MIKCPGGGLTVNDRMTIIRVQPCPDTGKKGEADMFIPELKTEIMDRVKVCYRKEIIVAIVRIK